MKRTNADEGSNKTRKRFRQIMKKFVEQYQKINDFAKYESLTNECKLELDKIKKADSIVFNNLYGAYISVLNAKLVAESRLTGKPSPRI